MALFQSSIEASEKQTFFADTLVGLELLSHYLRDKFGDVPEAAIQMKKAIDVRAKFLE